MVMALEKFVLAVAFARDCGITTASTSTLENMWKKAEHLVQSSGGILKVPWSSDTEVIRRHGWL